MSNPYGETSPYGEPEQGRQQDQGQGQERPQPRYGAYAARSESSGEPAGEQPSAGGQPNPYGEPTWGRPGADSAGQSGPYAAAAAGGQYSTPTQPGWQQPPQQPGDRPGSWVTQKPQRPLTLVLSMVLMLAAGALSLAWGIYVMVTVQAQDASELLTDQMRDTMITSFENDPQLQELSPEEVMEMTLTGIGVLALIWAIVLLAVYVALAFVGTMTGNVGRVLATIWLTGSLLFLLLSLDGISFAIIAATVLASIAALVLLWLPASNTFVHQRRAFKDARRNRQYGGGFPYSGGQSGPGQQPPYSGSNNPYAG